MSESLDIQWDPNRAAQACYTCKWMTGEWRNWRCSRHAPTPDGGFAPTRPEAACGDWEAGSNYESEDTQIRRRLEEYYTHVSRELANIELAATLVTWVKTWPQTEKPRQRAE